MSWRVIIWAAGCRWIGALVAGVSRSLGRSCKAATAATEAVTTAGAAHEGPVGLLGALAALALPVVDNVEQAQVDKDVARESFEVNGTYVDGSSALAAIRAALGAAASASTASGSVKKATSQLSTA